MSLHEPIVPVNLESNTRGGCRIIGQKLHGLLSPYKDKIDLSALEKYIG